MVAALVRWQFDLANTGVFTNAPAERVIGDVQLREGAEYSHPGRAGCRVAMLGATDGAEQL